MDAKTGRIVELTEHEAKQAEKEHSDRVLNLQKKLTTVEKELAANPLVPLTEEQAAYFKSKGLAFRQLWGKRIMRGLTVEEKDRLNALIELSKIK